MGEKAIHNFRDNFINYAKNPTTVMDNIVDLLEYKKSKNFKINQNDNGDIEAQYQIENMPVVHLRSYSVINEEELNNLHKKLWNLNEAPISIIVLPNEIRIYNNFIPPYQDDKLLFPKITTSGLENLKNLLLFKGSEIHSGKVWEKLLGKFRKASRVDKDLLNNLEGYRRKLNRCGLKYEYAHNLLARCIFIKYLEDREILTPNVFKQYDVSTFTELLSSCNKEKLESFFIMIKKTFNGDLFDISQKEREAINEEHLSLVFMFFEGTQYINNQMRLFPYDFSLIPVELVSNIYETFLDKNNKSAKSKQGIYYTPYFLVDFVLNNSLDYLIEDKDKYNIKVLDPACGSGIFLVEAYRRLVRMYKKKNEEVTVEALKWILKECIYGIDLSEEAIKIACFSLYIAMMDYIEPKDIFKTDIKFPNLIGSNLFVGDFFDTTHKFNDLKADLIIGNPPWKSTKGKLNMHEKYAKTNDIPISDRQIAYSFMARAKDFAHGETNITFIITSKFFYNHQAKKFRRYILDNFDLEFVNELSLCRNMIFDKAVGPAAIISYKLRTNKNLNNYTYHYSLKPSLFTKVLKKIVIDTSEIVQFSRETLYKNDDIWKILLYGSMIDFHFIKRLQKNKRLNEFIKLNDWEFGQGYKRGTPQKYHDDLLGFKLINTDRNKGKVLLERFFCDWDSACELTDESEVFLESKGTKQVYSAPHLLIKRGMPRDNRCIAGLLLKDAVFTNSINAISAYNYEESTIKKMRYIEGILNSKLCSYYHFHTSYGWGVERDEILKREHEEFPIIFPEEDKELFEKIVTKVEIMEYTSQQLYQQKEDLENNYNICSTVEKENDFYETEKKLNLLQSELDYLVYRLYDLDEIEINIIDNTHKMLMGIFREKNNASAFSSINEEDIIDYVKVFINHFNYVLKNKQQLLKASVYLTNNYYTAINFEICEDKNEKMKSIQYIKNIDQQFVDILGFSSIEEITYDVYLSRKIRGFSNNSFYIVKTNEKKNWSKISSLVDLNEFTKDMFYAERGNDNEKIF